MQVVVLKEPKRLPADPPFGPQLPFSDWTETLDSVSATLEPIICKGGSDCYEDWSSEELASNKAALADEVAKWVDRAEVDLLDILGAKQSDKNGRGGVVKTISVNLINTFKVRDISMNMYSRAIKWVFCRFRELSRALSKWAQDAQLFDPVTSYRRVTALVDATIKNGIIKSPLHKLRFESRRSWENGLKSVILQVSSLTRLSDFRAPEPNILRAIVARCDMYSAKAAAEAMSAEKTEQAESHAAWKNWAAAASNASAGTAHRYTKIPISETIEDIVGTSMSKSDKLQAEVNSWSALWMEGENVPVPQFDKVQRLPRISGEEIRLAALSF